MRKLLFLAPILVAGVALAAVSVPTGPTSLVTTATTVGASSAALPLFSFHLSRAAADTDTLTSVAVAVNAQSGSTVSSDDILKLELVKDNNADGIYQSGDTLVGTASTVNVNGTTVISANNAAIAEASTTYFVVMYTDSTWASGDAVTVTMPANAVVTSVTSPTNSAVTTAVISADSTGPALTSAVAKNKVGSTKDKEAGDYLEFTFNEATNKATINSANIHTVLTVNNGHSLRDGSDQIGSAAWNEAGTVLTVTLSATTSLPTVVVGDMVTLGGSVIKDTAGNSATGSQTITGTFGYTDTTGPILKMATAYNKTGGTADKEAGDYVQVLFKEATDKPAITASNIDAVLVLNSSHTWKDGAGAIGSAAWSSDGMTLTVTLSASSTLPSVAVGDTVTVTGSTIKDAAGNSATGTVTIGGNFAKTETSKEEDDDDDEDFGKNCGIIKNGKLYQIEGSPTVYLAAACRLKPFRGANVFKARGHKFQDIIKLTQEQANSLTISSKPALPAGGTLVKGTKKTVWFVTEDGKLLGFTSEKAFKRLGFNFTSVKEISDSDLNTMPAGSNIEENSTHPEGAVLKCTQTATVYMMKGGKRLAFTNPVPYLERGHTWDAIAVVDCQTFQYPSGTNIAQ